ncbi:MAG: SIS domain-containing protein [Candidatus Aenigmatarchaeota archaeon]
MFFKKSVDSVNMKKEIEDQGKSMFLTIENELEEIKKISKKISNCKRFVFSGCGDKYIVPLASKFLWSHVSPKPLDVIHSWLLKNYPLKYLGPKTCVVFVSQSGTTYDTVDACKKVIEKKCHVVAITNLKEEKSESLVEICSNYKNGYIVRTHTKSYPERSLPSTGTFHTSLLVLNLLTIFSNKAPGKITDLLIKYVPEVVDNLSTRDDVKEWGLKEADEVKKFSNFYVVGFGPAYMAARKQARIMMMEGAKVNACDIEGEEFIHSLIETLEGKPNPLILLKPSVDWIDTYRNFVMVKKFWEGKSKITTVDPFQFLEKRLSFIFSGVEGEFLSPFIYLPQLEWFSYYLSLKRGFDPGVGHLVKKVRSKEEVKLIQ